MRRRMITSIMQVLMIVAVLAPLGASSRTVKTTPPEPLSAGPFPVGVTTTVFVDTKRTDSFTRQPRTLVTEIWYPAANEARRMPKNKYSDFIPGGVTPQIDELITKTYKLSAAQMDKVYWNEARRNAPVRKGRFPLVVFSHGNGGSRNQNTFWCDYLASHGYIIVSADHTGNARWTIIDGKPVVFQGGERNNSAKDRPIDVSFLLDQMIEWDKGADKRFKGRIDTEHAAVTGMSFGSFTAHWASDQDPRFKAVIAMSGAPASHTNLTVPSLRMLGTEDRTLGVAGNTAIRDNHAKHTGPSYLLELKNGGHYSFTDMFKINKSFGDGVGAGKRRDTNEPFEFTSMETTYKIINSYSVAFLGYYYERRKGVRELSRREQLTRCDDLGREGCSGRGESRGCRQAMTWERRHPCLLRCVAAKGLAFSAKRQAGMPALPGLRRSSSYKSRLLQLSAAQTCRLTLRETLAARVAHVS